MKLSPRDALRYFARPDPARTGLLIHGPDTMRIALRRQEVIAALIGPEGEAEMRLTRISAADLRKDAAQLGDAIKATGFFPGPRVVFVEDAGDGLAKAVGAALADWREGDAQIVVTAGQLNARSALRKLFEAHPNAHAAAIYADPPTREEIEDALAKAGLRDIAPAAMTDLTALARMIDAGDFRQTLEKLALYKHGDAAPVESADVAACAPSTSEAVLDDALDLVAEGRKAELGDVMQRLRGQGMTPISIVIGASRHFRRLHAAAADPKGVEAGLARARPPVFGPRRDRMARQARAWGMHRLEEALRLLTDTDLALRSARPVPAAAMLERALIRLAMMVKR
ncbi:DNA polymerase III subunit delta [Maritimibacter sp. 55A14]|uniref:DNA polymerase III subunit delta n=1 Tax=Maritimibacter sp. 55A14 TaxID=2174844 RepID=UPI000D6175FA|nr:DNA polymerase III subunit delta [Maritimibacter sp. 55A14]PWE33498.1 DNA polymerase III subunit delta [Maritimibacter sp. 55A14]